jgi:2,4-dienoyl-CoA reductase-like NADH-dependent reductase (Old Yellow Enzyme family)/thioredoxin reductase
MLELRNRFLFAPVKTGYGTGDGQVTQKHLNFYSLRSGYLGAVIPEPLYLHQGLREIPAQLGIDNDNKIAGLRQLTESIHCSGAKAIAHLNHPGRMANPKIPGNVFYSSSGQACENGGATPKPMDESNMEEVNGLFVSAARRAQQAGFDALELQFGHGYLLAQFLSQAVNDRKDNYGGSFENRIRFPLAVLSSLQKAVDLPVIVRLSGEEMIAQGIEIHEMIKLAEELASRKVAAIHVSAGTICSSPPWFFQHMFVPKGKTWEFAAKIKKAVDIPIIFVGRIDSKEDIDALINNYGADYLAIGRGLIADPDLVGKYLGKVAGRVCPCLGCSEGCLGGVKSGTGLRCVVNPSVGSEPDEINPANECKHYAVIGGGLAGMKSAITLCKRGHKVALYEKERLGGQFNLAHLPPHKESLKGLVDYYRSELEDHDITIWQKEADESDILNGGYSGAILATGSIPAVPPIEGLGEYYWAEVLEEENLPVRKKVVVIGGGLIGIETASKLVKAENEVIVVEMLDEIARGMEAMEKVLTLNALRAANVETHVGTRVTRIENGKVFVEGEMSGVIDKVDHIVLATGMRSYNPLEKELTGKIPVYVIGDAHKVGKAQDAIREAYELAKRI